tara:strand:- start:5890 stop:6087 length:198 start_codon:yes stop_codon:yes gene_type:complete
MNQNEVMHLLKMSLEGHLHLINQLDELKLEKQIEVVIAIMTEIKELADKVVPTLQECIKDTDQLN